MRYLETHTYTASTERMYTTSVSIGVSGPGVFALSCKSLIITRAPATPIY